MIRIHEIKLSPDEDNESLLVKEAAKRLGCGSQEILNWVRVKKSVDARRKDSLHFVYTIDVEVQDEVCMFSAVKDAKISLVKPQVFVLSQSEKKNTRPVVCGSGPAGLFAAYILAKAGQRPILLERGSDVDKRTKAVEESWSKGNFSPKTNVAFGEGGAGTFSDGKLTTGISDQRIGFVLRQLVDHGGPEEILYWNKPHIGTDRLRDVVKNIRKSILELGGEVYFDTLLTDLVIRNGELKAVEVQSSESEREIPTEKLILATGHSARDTFQMLWDRGIQLAAKPFSIGVRIEHLQSWLDRRQYGQFAGHPALGAADYKLAVHLKSGRTVYTFCMCPGGQVIGAGSAAGQVVVNGMSYHARSGENANSALLCEVRPSDFENSHPLAGIRFQQRWEKAAFELGGSNYYAPVSRLEDFLKYRRSIGCGEIVPTYLPGVTYTNVNECLPEFVAQSLKEGIPELDQRLRGFANPDAILTGVETRSSSPVRILRNDTLQSNIKGIYPAGEGAGYAGGIMSAAVDGIRAAEAVIASL